MTDRERSASWLAAVLCLAGCGADGGKSVDITLELAAHLAGSHCDVASRGDPSTVKGIELDVCRCDSSSSVAWAAQRACLHGDVACTPVPVTTPEGDHGTPMDASVLTPTVMGSFALDLQVGGGLHRVDVRFLDATGAPFAEGHTVVDSFARPVHVRVYPYQRVVCAGGLPERRTGDGSLPVPRALHVAIRLPNDDILLLGGVQGGAVPPGPESATGDWGSAAVEPTVEVYSAREERFFRVSGTFERVFFAARLLPDAEPSNEFRIRIVGGFRRGAKVDAAQSFTYHSAPVLPVADTPEPDALLRYFPEERRIEVEPMQPLGFSKAGGNATGEFLDGGDLAPVILEIDGTVYDRMTGHGFLRSYWWMSPDGTPRDGNKFELVAARFGATVTSLGRVALVWGGNINATLRSEMQSTAGEFLSPDSSVPTPVASGGGIPDPTAFHSATRLGDGVLIAGGLQVDCRNVADPTQCLTNHPLLTTYPDQPLSYLRGSSAATLTATSLEAGPYQASVYHAALGDGEGDVLLVGGAVAPTLTPSDQVVLVTPSGARERFGAAALSRARWGAAAALLPNHRVLVTGGFTRDGASGPFEAVPDAEVIYWGVAEGLPLPPADAGSPPDAGSSSDAGMGDSGGATSDASAPGPVDSGM